MRDRYPVTPDEANPNVVAVGFSDHAASCTALFTYDPAKRKVRRTGLVTDSLALQREGRLEEHIGKGPLANAEARAKDYFKNLHAAKRKRVKTK